MPFMPLLGLTIFPYMIIHLDVVSKRAIAAIDQAMLRDKRLVLATHIHDLTEAESEDTPGDVYAVGTVVEIRQIFKLPGGPVRILVEGLHRASIAQFLDCGAYDAVNAIEHFDSVASTPNIEALTRAVVHKFETWVKLSRRMPEEALISVTITDDAGRLADLIIGHLSLKKEVRQQLLESIDIAERLEKLYGVLLNELKMLETEKKIIDRVENQIEAFQKENFLREQLKAIHTELGDDEKAAMDDYRERMKRENFPDYVKDAVEHELARLDRLHTMSPDAAVIRTYLDCLFDLPWNKTSDDEVAIDAAAKILNKDHYGLEKVKERILDFLAVHQLARDKSAPILCLVGPPGVGKTSLAESVARATGRKFVRASLGGIRDEAEIRGHRRTYVGALPGRIIEGIRRIGTKNPVFLLDEVDKLNQEYHGDPSAALLEVLDPAQNSTFTDHYVDLAFDLSKVFWIVTANDLSQIPRPLSDRMEIITLSSYTELEKAEIAKRHLFARQRANNGLKAKDVTLGTGVIEKIIAEYTKEAGVRELERLLGQVCRKAARQIVEGKATKTVRVTKQNLAEFLEKPKYISRKAVTKPQVGVSTGMAWTQVGGDILPTEATVLKGKGKLILTGQLGDVMQESAKAGLSYIRSRADKFKLADDFYEKYDIHIHLPEGAIPKDGPSAGITMATAMISALTNRKVRNDVAMTGEITLRGNVLPIGGLKEKVLAAYREGMNTIILPKENERDIEDIPECVRDKLSFVTVEHMDEVLKTALV